MGPSGSGKTSLLNCLAHKNSSYTGQILLNGRPASANTVARFSGFVQQVQNTPYHHIISFVIQACVERDPKILQVITELQQM
jgi:ABC-type cobalamin/Fe3+-siderophores transport system ATPase subunit